MVKNEEAKPKKGQLRRGTIKTQAQRDEQDRRVKAKSPPNFPWSEEMEDQICFEVATTAKRLKEILDENEDFPSERQFYKELLSNSRLEQKYNNAKKQQQDVKLDYQREVLARARESTYIDQQGNHRIDSPAVALAKIECDNIKWEAARLARKKYGKIEIELTGDKEATDNVRKMLEKAKSKKHERDF